MANEKILVVDDDTNICELLRLYLTKEGYQVTTANDGEEGLEKFNQLKPDMVLLDVMMPRMDGLEVCRRILSHNTPPFPSEMSFSRAFADLSSGVKSSSERSFCDADISVLCEISKSALTSPSDIASGADEQPEMMRARNDAVRGFKSFFMFIPTIS